MRSFKGSLFYALCFFILALLSKPMAVSLPFVLLILDWYPFQRIRSLKTFGRASIEKLPFFALSLGSSLLTLMAQSGAIQPVEAFPLSVRLLVAAKSLLAYLWNMVVPIKLLPFYPYPQDATLLSLEYLSAIVLVLGITAACLVAARRHKVFPAVWGYYVVTLIPVLGIVQVGAQAMADRYTYLPSIGPFLIIGLIVAWVSLKVDSMRRWGLAPGLATVAAVILLSVPATYLTVKQTAIWKDTFTLWNYLIEKQPAEVPFFYTNRGSALMAMGQLDRAIEDFNKAITLNPSDYKAHANLGRTYQSMGQLNKAIESFDKAIALNPSFFKVYYDKGIAYGEAGLFDKSIESLTKSLEMEPTQTDAYVSRGVSYARIGQHDRALDDFDRAIQLDQNHVMAYLNRGNLYRITDRKDSAVSDYQKACDLGSESACAALTSLQQATTEPKK
jgi:Tfp pilus assembly protein PilF